jgi:hypothetical protein
MAPPRMTGVEETVRFLRAFRVNVPAFARAALEKAANAVLEESQRLVPVRQEGEPPENIPPGSLKSSGRVNRGGDQGDSVYYSVSYGAPYGLYREANYALVVHEMPYKHVVGQWKYLTTAVDIVAPDLREIIAANFAQMTTAFFGTSGGAGQGRTPLSNTGTGSYW